MAGIGFELKKLFVGRSLFQKARAYAYASMVCSGTTLLAVVLLVGLGRLAKWAGASPRESEVLVVLTVYAMLGSMLLTALLQMLLSRYTADMIYGKQYDRILPSLYGGTLLLMVPGGIAYAILLSQSHDISLINRALDWFLLMEMILVWLQMAYITAVKDYRRILLGFLFGVCAALIFGFVLLQAGISVITALLTATLMGYGVMAFCFSSVLHGYFSMGHGSVFHFLGWIGKFPSLIWIGFFGILGAFIHMILMWYSDELGSVISGWLRHAPAYDAASFYAFLVSLPTMINFVVSVEVNFYTRYRKYFDAITNGGSLAEIELARTEMIAVLKQEVFQLAQVQVFALIIYMVLMKYYLVTIGFTHDMLSMFRILCVGYSAYAVGNSLMLLQLYFDDRKGAMGTVWTFFIANLLLTAYVRNQASLLYGSGMLIAGCLMYAVGLIRLMHYVREIDYHVYCGQPVLAVVRISHWETLSQWLDARALRKSAPSIPTKEEIHT